MLSQIYPVVLGLHSGWRWVVLLAAVAALVAAVAGLVGQRPFAPLGRKTGLIYVTALDMQLLMGIVLFAASPLVSAALADMGAAMKIKELRFLTVEHGVLMLLAVALAHIGSARAKRAATDALKYRRMLVWYAASFLVMLAGIPWARPLLRGLVGPS